MNVVQSGQRFTLVPLHIVGALTDKRVAARFVEVLFGADHLQHAAWIGNQSIGDGDPDALAEVSVGVRSNLGGCVKPAIAAFGYTFQHDVVVRFFGAVRIHILDEALHKVLGAFPVDVALKLRRAHIAQFARRDTVGRRRTLGKRIVLRIALAARGHRQRCHQRQQSSGNEDPKERHRQNHRTAHRFKRAKHAETSRRR